MLRIRKDWSSEPSARSFLAAKLNRSTAPNIYSLHALASDFC